MHCSGRLWTGIIGPMVTPPTIELGSISMADSLILMVLALVVFGPRRLPQIGKQIGKLMYEFRKASNDFKFQMEEELRIAEDADRRKKEEAERQKALAAQKSQESVSALPPAATVNAIENPNAAEPGVSQPAATPEPRILPPSTGEQVAASRPARSPEPAIGAGATTGSEPASGDADGTGETAKTEPARVTETVSHNG